MRRYIVPNKIKTIMYVISVGAIGLVFTKAATEGAL